VRHEQFAALGEFIIRITIFKTSFRFHCHFYSLFFVTWILSCLFLATASTQAQDRSASNPDAEVARLLSTYKLAAGDVITIRVFGEDDLSREKVRLTDAGTIPYPVLGEVKALGLTIGEIERSITTGLNGRYLVNPRVSVTIEEYRPFYINGMVEKPGGYPFQPGLTVLKASSLAGGFKERASFSKISIIRESDPKAQPQKADINTIVNPGDTIFIEESFF
jgi:protein involved in polysaccharide export with SLBB domain